MPFRAGGELPRNRTPGEWSGKWALVTGASAGIGVALAEELASGGTNLVLTARRKDRLQELAHRLTSTYRVSTEAFPADLADSSAAEKVFAFTKEKRIEIELLVNNAGFGQYGEFSSIEKQRLLDMVQVNCHAVVHLTRLYLPEMITRGHGDVLILASTASFQAVPYISTLRHESVRFAFRRRPCRRDEASRNSRVRPLPRLDGIGIPRHFRPGEIQAPHGNRRKSRAHGTESLGRRKKLRHLRLWKLSWRSRRTPGPPPLRHQNRR